MATTHNQPPNQSTYTHQREISNPRPQTHNTTHGLNPQQTTTTNHRINQPTPITQSHQINPHPQINLAPTNQPTPRNQPNTHKSTHPTKSTQHPQINLHHRINPHPQLANLDQPNKTQPHPEHLMSSMALEKRPLHLWRRNTSTTPLTRPLEKQRWWHHPCRRVAHRCWSGVQESKRDEEE